MAKDPNPAADLDDPRNIDVPAALFPRLSLFAGLKPAPSLDKFPGSVVLRRYPKGDLLCRQAEPGWTAYYILTAKDMDELRHFPGRRLAEIPEEQKKRHDNLAKNRSQAVDMETRKQTPGLPEADRKDLQKKSETLAKDNTKLEKSLKDLDEETRTWAAFRPIAEATFPELTTPPPPEPLAMAEAYLTQAAPGAPRLLGWWQRLTAWRQGRDDPAGSLTPPRVRFDGPADFADERRINVMVEGDLLGEKSCLQRTPRSATVVATRDCYVLVLLRNILVSILKDKNHEKRTLDVLRTRSLRTYFLDFPIFRALSEQQLNDLCEKVELEAYEPGALIYDEHDRSECMHLIGAGLVKVMHHVSWLYAADDIADWPSLIADLKAQTASAASGGNLGQLLPSALRQLLQQPVELSEAVKTTIVAGLNEVLKSPTVLGQPLFTKVVRNHRLGLKVWQIMAAAPSANEPGLLRLNRLLLEALLPGAVPSRKTTEEDEGPAFRIEEFCDWRALAAKLVADAKPPTDPIRCLWDLLTETSKARFRVAQGTAVSAQDAAAMVEALNDLLTELPWLLLAPVTRFLEEKWQVAKKVQEFLPRGERWTSFAFERWTRAFNRVGLEALLPNSLGKARRPTGPPVVVAYRGRGEFIGEIGLMEGKPRSATCVAYNHPDNDPERETGPVYLVRMSKDLFEQLLAQLPQFRRQVEEVIARRKESSQESLTALASGPVPRAMVSTEQVGQLGLPEGQRLMLIDLDRCTRCDECVQACVTTHADGRSRLFLSGPRVDHHYLVPTTCRSCLDPVCMIGCPVGSIHRGQQGEMLIRDWCIGCGLCAKQCPYGAIQMHPLGLAPEGAFGWRWAPAPTVAAANWQELSFSDRDWHIDRAPFTFDRVFQEAMGPGPSPPGQPICFRFTFPVEQETLGRLRELTLEVISTEQAIGSAAVWLNGQEITTTERAKRGRREYPVANAQSCLRRGNNTVAVRITPGAAAETPFFDLCLYEVRKLAEELTEKVVTHRAVVCDLCSSLPNGPACVRACPHDAAMRVDGQQFTRA